MKKIVLIVGTRPNYIKAFPVYDQLIKHSEFNVQIIHTGQHYDYTMNGIFFKELGIPEPHISITLESTNECEQLVEIMDKLHKIFIEIKPDLILVFGDVTSTLAGSLVANKMKIKLGHIESGLRSKDMTMPEEINRILVDSMADYLFVTEESAIYNLNLENIAERSQIFYVGNTMIDTLVKFIDKFDTVNNINKKSISFNDYIVLTIHRQSNVDNKQELTKIIMELNSICAEGYKFVFPIHHRTIKKIDELGIKLHDNIIVISPQSYLSFINYVKNSKLVITDSGGIQEETTYLGIPCITLRHNTERPATLMRNGGSSCLSTIDNLATNIKKYYGNSFKTDIFLWDGKASERIVSCIKLKIL